MVLQNGCFIWSSGVPSLQRLLTEMFTLRHPTHVSRMTTASCIEQPDSRLARILVSSSFDAFLDIFVAILLSIYATSEIREIERFQFHDHRNACINHRRAIPKKAISNSPPNTTNSQSHVIIIV